MTDEDVINSLVFFQSTLLQEERLVSAGETVLATAFNPRSYKRSDDMQTIVNNFDRLSIHAPTRGATKAIARPSVVKMLSIHAPTRGATG